MKLSETNKAAEQYEAQPASAAVIPFVTLQLYVMALKGEF